MSEQPQVSRGKELFVQYLGSKYHMFREGELEEYNRLGIAPETELEWSKELIAVHAKELSIRDWNAVERLVFISKNYKDATILSHVLAFTSRHINSSDSIVRLMYAEKIIEIIKHLSPALAAEALLDALRKTRAILQDVINGPLVVDPGHELQRYNLTDKRSLNSRAQKSIDVLYILLEQLPGR